jgi:hypothetical protein
MIKAGRPRVRGRATLVSGPLARRDIIGSPVTPDPREALA